MEKQKCPEVRFKGFDRGWGAKNLSELGEIQTGSTPSTTEDSNYSKLGLLWVTPTDINSQLILNSGKKLSIIGREKARIVPANTILVTCIASIGKNGLLQEEASFNQQINSLTPYVGNEPYFLLSQSYFWSERMKQFAAKGTMQ
ncbi:MAG: restriction endonuclease subunit S, partial [Acinetobacter sp.]